MSKARKLLDMVENDGCKWVSNDGGDGYILKDSSGEEIGAIAADNPGSWHAYKPGEDYPIAGPFETAKEAASEVEMHLDVQADQSELPNEEEGGEGSKEDESDDEDDEEEPEEDDDGEEEKVLRKSDFPDQQEYFDAVINLASELLRDPQEYDGYSGRGMMGDKSSLAFTTSTSPRSDSGAKFCKAVPGMRVDNMGMDFIYYFNY